MDAAATERDWFNLQDAAGLVLAKGMFLRLTIACCVASIAAAQDVPQSATREIAAAANEFVATLDESQQGKLIYDFRDEAQRKRWHYFPPGMFLRGGLRVGDLAERQRAAAMRVLAAALRPWCPAKGGEFATALGAR